MQKEKSCGAVVFTRTKKGLRYLLVKNLRGFYGFPKGHVEGSETEEETALREVAEETGVQIQIIPGFRMTDVYPIPGQEEITKEVVYFVGSFTDQIPRPQEKELQSVQLCAFEEAMNLLAFEHQREVLAKAKEFVEENKKIRIYSSFSCQPPLRRGVQQCEKLKP